jgi:hypothetical protein
MWTPPMPIFGPPEHYVDLEFAALFGDFEDRGGKQAPCVDEDWERIHRQQATCIHGLPIRECAKCRKPLPTYWPHA